jgi:hypothetical protein
MTQSTTLPLDPQPGLYNHPALPTRHSYPVAIRGAGIVTAFGLLMRTLPYALVRFAILVAFSVATILWFVVTFGGGAWLGARLAVPIGWVWIIGGLCLYGYVWQTILRYALHLIECGHVAVLTELITRGSLRSGGQGMFAYGRQIVQAKFGEATLLFGLHTLVRGVVGAFNRTLDFIGELLPVPGLDAVMRIINLILRAATRYIDKAIFSYNLARGDENPWRSSRDGLVYYCQNAKEILKTAAWIVVLDRVLTVLAWIVLLAPSAALALALPESVRNLGTIVYILIAALFASNIRAAFIKPLFLIMVIVKFHTMIEGQAINETWDSRLTQLSGQFAKIKEEAQAWAGATPKPVA